MNNEVIKPKMTFSNELRFTPYVWAKLLYMRDKGSTEVAGYGITGTDDPLLVTDFKMVRQECTGGSFDLDPGDGAEFMELMMDAGLMPWQYSNILIHTHPGNCPKPSMIDEDNFKKAFSHPNWAIMFIVADGGDVYCRLKVNIGPGVVRELKVAIDYSISFNGSDIKGWDEEYKSKVNKKKFRMTGKESARAKRAASIPNKDDPLWWNDEHDKWVDFDEAQQLEFDQHEKLDTSECYWDTDGNVVYLDDDSSELYIYDPIGQRWYREDYHADDDGVQSTYGGYSVVEIDIPREPWAAQVVAWAEKHANNRECAVED